MDVSVSRKSKRERLKNRPNELSILRTKRREERLAMGSQMIFVNNQYLEYDKTSFGNSHIQANSWNENYKLSGVRVL